MPNQYTTNPMPIVDRFWSRVARSETCWTWTGALQKTGYGRLKIDQRGRFAHIVAWWIATGQWPQPGQCVCHACDNRACVRNDDTGSYVVDGIAYERRGHLWLGSIAANMRDMCLKQRAASGDANGSRLHPERLKRGDENPSRLYPDRRPRGEAHARSKVTDDMVREILACHRSGGNLAALARAMGIGKTTIHKIARRETWQHV